MGRRGYRRLQDGQLHQRDPGAHPQVSRAHDDDDDDDDDNHAHF